MPINFDMKEQIVEASKRLLMEKNVKKLTVTDICQECNITRQAFYYHFESIVDMLKWAIRKEGTEIYKNDKAVSMLEQNREKLDELAKYLYEKETITGEEFMNILNSGETR